jgi:RNA polymerase sigma-70 factor (ECF subfamily)
MKAFDESENDEESVLIANAARGDLDSFNHLVRKYQDLLYNHAYGLLGDSQMAEDVTQDGFIRAFEHINQFRGGSFRAWLLKIVTNVSHDVARRFKRHPTVSLSSDNENGEEMELRAWGADPGPSVEALVDRNAFTSQVYQALDELPAAYRSVVTLIDLQELDYVEVAHILKIPLGTVKSRLTRGRLRLRQLLEPVRDSEYRASLAWTTLAG